MLIRKKIFILTCFFVLCFLVEVLGGLLTRTSVNSPWYVDLAKASWNPPPWVFGPVWTLLYTMIAISGWLVFLKPFSKKRTQALLIYAVQLFLGLLWSFFFFYLQMPLLGLLDILALLGLVLWMTIAFWKLSRTASVLLFPYLIWTAYAVTLNTAIWILN